MISAGVSSITKPSLYFDAKLYTGTGALQTINTFGFEPGLLWIKDRTSANSHGIFGNGSGNSSGTLTFTKGVNLFGNASVLGTLSKGGGTFVIDHPLDPQNMLLYHSFVESPEPKNIYDGNATLGQDGSVTIELPAYFLALNQDFRYLASPVGDAMPNLHLAEEVHQKYFNLVGPAVFSIAGGKPGGTISWQITGNRHDPFILAHPIVVEVEKGPGALYDKGQCLVPSLCL